MKNLNLKIDTEKCIRCGLCISDCVGSVLEFDENKIPKVKQNGEKTCIKCQHCLAICPTGALSIFDKNPENSSPKKTTDPEGLINLIQTRRSIRQFKNENVSPEITQKLKKMLAYVPTGCNARALHFNFVEDKTKTDEMRNYCIKKLKSLAWLLPSKLSNYKESIIKGEDVIFRDAPHMIVVSCDKNAPCKDIDPIIALSYFDLYAQSLGVGTLWCGFADIAFKMFPKLKKCLNLPKGHKISYVMLYGMPKVSYPRAIQPDEYKIN